MPPCQTCLKVIGWCATRRHVGRVILPCTVCPVLYWYQPPYFYYPIVDKLFPLLIFSMNPIERHLGVCETWAHLDIKNRSKRIKFRRDEFSKEETRQQLKPRNAQLGKWRYACLQCNKMSQLWVNTEINNSCICSNRSITEPMLGFYLLGGGSISEVLWQFLGI